MTPIRTLIVDDDTDVHDSIRSMLPRESFHFEMALNTQDAITKFPDFKPDLVLLDIHMPGANGFVALRRLHALSRDHSPQCRVIMLTRSKTKEDVTTALSYGAKDYLAKPLTANVLRQKIFRHFPEARRG